MGQRDTGRSRWSREPFDAARLKTLAVVFLTVVAFPAQGAAGDVQADVDRCENGDAATCSKAGLAYATGSGVAKDPARAAAFYQKACESGNALGCSNLGVLYANGEGVAQDLKRATELFRKGCQAGLQRACANLEALNQK